MRVMAAAALTVALLGGTGGPVWARQPPGPPVLSSGWSRTGDELTWHSAERVRIGDAAVEFRAGDRLLGRPTAAADGRSFRLRIRPGDPLTGLRVVAAGRPLDATAVLSPRRGVPDALPPNGTDPGINGPFRTVTGEYHVGGRRVPGLAVQVEMRAVVVAPRTTGRHPLALFLHGRHATCFRGSDPDAVTGSWPCGPGQEPIPSYRGYLRAQRLLASQGFVTVSISANGISGQDEGLPDGGAQARSVLVRRHLAAWVGWAGPGRGTAPAIVRSAPAADLSRVLLIGHSRGGEGVSRAATDSLTPPPGDPGEVSWTVRGLLLIGPTSFGQNPVADVPSATILPGCDGDVADLQGQLSIDGTRAVGTGQALHSSLYVIGANHNFFNAEWTPGLSAAPSWDDSESSGDPGCSAGDAERLSPDQVQLVGATYVAAAARLFVGGDDRVRPLLDGTGVRARSADPARVLSHALGAGRTAVVLPALSDRVTGGRICTEVGPRSARPCLGGHQSPHFVPFAAVSPEAGRYALTLAWSAPGRPVTVRPSVPVAVPGATALTLRIIVAPDTVGTRLGVTVLSPGGRRTALGEVRIDGLRAYWGQEVRVPLGGFRGRMAGIELTPRSRAGQAWLLDAWGWRAGSPAGTARPVPRLDLGHVTTRAIGSGPRILRIPARVTGSGSGRIRLFLTGPGPHRVTSWVVTVRPGVHSIPVDVPVRGEQRYELDAKAVHGTMIGAWQGGLVVTGDR